MPATKEWCWLTLTKRVPVLTVDSGNLPRLAQLAMLPERWGNCRLPKPSADGKPLEKLHTYPQKAQAMLAGWPKERSWPLPDLCGAIEALWSQCDPLHRIGAEVTNFFASPPTRLLHCIPCQSTGELESLWVQYNHTLAMKAERSFEQTTKPIPLHSKDRVVGGTTHPPFHHQPDPREECCPRKELRHRKPGKGTHSALKQEAILHPKLPCPHPSVPRMER